MKRAKKLLALLLGLIMLAGLAACNTSDVSPSNSQAPGTPSPTNSAKPSPSTSDEPLTVLYMPIMTFMDAPARMPAVIDAVNKITESKINVKVDIELINIGAYDQQITLMVASNEKLDFAVSNMNISTLVSKNMLLPLNDLIDQYGQGIKDALGDYLYANAFNGTIYAIPSMRDFGQCAAVAMRKDLVDKYNIDISAIKTFADLEPVLAIIKANEPDIIPLVSTGNSVTFLSSIRTEDQLGDGIGVLMDAGATLDVVNRYETDEYVAQLNVVRDWFNKGYISKDVATTTDAGTALIKAGKAFAYLGSYTPGGDNNNTKVCGTEMVGAQLSDIYITGAPLQRGLWTIPITCKTPEKAIQLLNLMYTDPDIANLLSWGIEGEDYTIQPDGTINYPDGKDANSCYNLNMGWLMGNEFISHVWHGNAPTLWDEMDAFNKQALTNKSKAFGFAFDQTPVKTEIVAITNVINQYAKGLEFGVVDPQTTLPEFQKALKAAGIDIVIAEKQKQLDAWAAANNVN